MITGDRIVLASMFVMIIITMVLLFLMLFYPSGVPPEIYDWVLILLYILILIGAMKMGLLYLSGSLNWFLLVAILIILVLIIAMIK